MVVFHSDLDNTLIYSYKKEIGSRKRCVEIYQGREISFVTDRTHQLLKEAAKQMLFVPTTTRTTEQYARIDLGLGEIPYALVCNGGVLLANGREDLDWYRESQRMVEDCADEMGKAQQILAEDESRCFEVRNIRKLFLFTKSERPQASVRRLREGLSLGKMEVFSNGSKVYAVPKVLNKGEAVRRFRRWADADMTVAAGDSAFDIPMLCMADLGFAPRELGGDERLGGSVRCMGSAGIFSEWVLEQVKHLQTDRHRE